MKMITLLLPSFLLLGCGDEQLDKLLEAQADDADLDGVTTEDGDCDDTLASINPYVTDLVGDGVDQNCDWVDGTDNDGDGVASSISGGEDCDDNNPEETELIVVYTDVDDDGFGTERFELCGLEDGYATRPGDCDDNNAEVHPDADEVCDGVDNNCDDVVDENLTAEYYADGDGDGYGSPFLVLDSCEVPEGYVTDNTDFDDSSAAAYPGAEEICDGIDNDGIGGIDDGVLSTFYLDSDGDGYGSETAVELCSASAGYVTDNTDFDDSSAAAYPGAEEICDGIDNDGIGGIDDGVLNSYYLDADSDGYGAGAAYEGCEVPEGYVTDNTDFDDSSAAAYPGAEEICDGVDNDGIGGVDDGVDSSYYLDADSDGYGAGAAYEGCEVPGGYVTDNTDFDDSSAAAYPGAEEICDGIDNDGIGGIDDGVLSTFYLDSDGDGYGSETAVELCSASAGYVTDNTDFDDSSAAAYPGAEEICDGVDNDGVGGIDDGVQVRSYADLDNDGYGDSDRPYDGCSIPAGYVLTEGDCSDLEALVSPDAVEICDTIDNNCNGLIDDDDETVDPASKILFYIDNDSDGYGDPNGSSASCSPEEGYVENDTDCDDTDPLISPVGLDIPNDDIDQDCSGEDEEPEDYFGLLSIGSLLGAEAFCEVYDSVWGALNIDANGWDVSALECVELVDGELHVELYQDTSLTTLTSATDVVATYYTDSELSLSSLVENQSLTLYGTQVEIEESEEEIEEESTAEEESIETEPELELAGDKKDGKIYDPTIYFTAVLNRQGDSLIPLTGAVTNEFRISFDDQLNPVCLIIHELDDKSGSNSLFLEEGAEFGWIFPPQERHTRVEDCDWLPEEYNEIFDFFYDTTIGVGVRETRGTEYGRFWYYTDDSVGLDLYFEGSDWAPASFMGTGAAYQDINVALEQLSMVPPIVLPEEGLGLPDGQYYLQSMNADQMIFDVNAFNFETVVLPQTSDIDNDRDGYTEDAGDCDDSDASVSPLDVDGDGVAGCDGDCDDLDAMMNLMDWDNDGYSSCDGDCDDFDVSTTGVDSDQDGYTLCGGDCDDSDPTRTNGDVDEDGVSSCDGDCNDLDPLILPGVMENIMDGQDNDCDGLVDERKSFKAEALQSSNSIFSIGVQLLELSALESIGNLELHGVQSIDLSALTTATNVVISGSETSLNLSTLSSVDVLYLQSDALSTVSLNSLVSATEVYVECSSGTFDGQFLSEELTGKGIEHSIVDCLGESYGALTGYSEVDEEEEQEEACSTIVDLSPVQGAFDVFYRDSLTVRFSNDAHAANLWLEDDDGALIDGEMYTDLLTNEVSFLPSTRLASSTRYRLMLSYCASEEPIMIPFETSSEGEPVAVDLENELYMFTLVGASFEERESASYPLNTVITYASSTYLEIMTQGSDLIYREASADYCDGAEHTISFNEDPYAEFIITGADVYADYVTLIDPVFSGYFEPDGSSIKGRLDAIFDARMYDLLRVYSEDMQYSPDDLCSFYFYYGYTCEPCAEDGASYCVSFSLVDVVAELQENVQDINPQEPTISLDSCFPDTGDFWGNQDTGDTGSFQRP